MGAKRWLLTLTATAVAIALLERSPFNAFATWRMLATPRAYRPRLPRGPAPTAGPPTSSVEIVP